MAINEYHFVTEWRFTETTIEELSEILADAPALARWWPSVYLKVDVLDPGDSATGVGKHVSLFTKGWLPYTLKWSFRVTEARPPHGFSLEATGDFEGKGVWSFVQEGANARVTYDWRIRAEKPLLKTLSFALKPVFGANHEWAMARGEESLRLELARRRAKTDEERAKIAPPPGATFR